MARTVAVGIGWQVSEVVCNLGPHDRPFEERHGAVSIALVTQGSFRYRSSCGEALLYPGAFLLGNAGTCFVCGHEHGVGDRCIAFRLAPELFEEVSATAARSHRFRFPSGMLPATRGLALPIVESSTRVRSGSPLAMEEWVIRLAEAIVATLAGGSQAQARPSPREQQRMSDVIRHVEENYEQKLDLSELAGVARMSRYHFLRTFRHTLGVTPHQFILDLRLRRVAVALCTTNAPISTLAFDAGFGDLSTFNARFRKLFGMSPGAFRRAGAAA